MKNKTAIATILRILLIVLGAALMIESVAAYRDRSFNLGIAMPFIIGLPLLLLGIFHKPVTAFFNSSVFGRIVKCGFISAYALFTLLFSVTTATILISSRTPKDIKPNVIIVLGASTKGSDPTVQLRLRLERALELYRESEDAYLIVSGGQGDDEEFSEAEVMKNWLVKSGVPTDKVIEEGRSESTVENFRYSKEIIDALVSEGRLTSEQEVAFVTNRFHVFRAERLAKNLGINAIGVAAREYQRFVLNDYMRECAAIVHHFLHGRL